MLDLYPFQTTGAEFLSRHRYAYLADEPGLGKTAQAVRACDLVAAERVVVICPAIAKSHWVREFSRVAETPPKELLVESYSRVATRTDIRAIIAALQPDVLILDEAHYLGSPHSKRTKAVLGRPGLQPGLASEAARVWCLSGTPAPSSVLALYPLLRVLWPHLLPVGVRSLEQFTNHFTHWMPTRYGVRVTGNKNADELRAMLSTMMLRRKVTEVLPDLPPLVWGSVVVPRVPGSTKELDALMDDLGPELLALAEFEGRGHERAGDVARLRRLVGEAKALNAAEMVKEELFDALYDKVIVFAHHRSVIEKIGDALSAYGVVTVTGDTPAAARDRAIQQFQTDPRTRVFLGQLQAASTAITLTAATHVVIVEPSWTPADNEQAARRALRIGQESPVFVRLVGLADSLDDSITRVIERKQRLLAEAFDLTTPMERSA